MWCLGMVILTVAMIDYSITKITVTGYRVRIEPAYTPDKQAYKLDQLAQTIEQHTS
jgi:hypothetical protein